MIVIACPECKKQFKFKDDYAGRKGKCPACRAIIIVPKKKDAPRSQVRTSFACPECENTLTVGDEKVTECTECFRQWCVPPQQDIRDERLRRAKKNGFVHSYFWMIVFAVVFSLGTTIHHGIYSVQLANGVENLLGYEEFVDNSNLQKYRSQHRKNTTLKWELTWAGNYAVKETYDLTQSPAFAVFLFVWLTITVFLLVDSCRLCVSKGQFGSCIFFLFILIAFAAAILPFVELLLFFNYPRLAWERSYLIYLSVPGLIASCFFFYVNVLRYKLTVISARQRVYVASMIPDPN